MRLRGALERRGVSFVFFSFSSLVARVGYGGAVGVGDVDPVEVGPVRGPRSRRRFYPFDLLPVNGIDCRVRLKDVHSTDGSAIIAGSLKRRGLLAGGPNRRAPGGHLRGVLPLHPARTHRPLCPPGWRPGPGRDDPVPACPFTRGRPAHAGPPRLADIRGGCMTQSQALGRDCPGYPVEIAGGSGATLARHRFDAPRGPWGPGAPSRRRPVALGDGESLGGAA